MNGTVADVNWMLGAAVQSGAALVAIVGGLLGSRYVSLHAEQQAARRRLAEVDANLAAAEDALARREADLTEYQVRDLLEDHDCYEALLESQNKLTLDEVLDAIGADESGVDRNALEQHLEVIRAELALSVGKLLELVPDGKEHPEWAVFRREHKVSPSVDHLWEWAYDRIVEDKEEEARRRAPRSLIGYDLGILPSVRPYFPPNPAWEVAHEDRLYSALRDAEANRERLEAERGAASRHLADAVQPEGFGLAIKVLVYIAATAMAVPIGLMVGAPTTLPLWVRIVVAVVFLSGVALLLRYLSVYARHLRGQAGTSFPERLTQLFRRR